MKCHFCKLPITPDQLHSHHVVPVADGGDPAGRQVPCHRSCHNSHHRENGDYRRWRKANHAERVAMFGAEEVSRLLAHWGRKGWRRLVETRGAEYLREFHKLGGRARAANGRDSRGRFTPVARPPRRNDPDHLLEAF